MSGTRHEQRQGDLVGSESYRGANFGGAASDYARYRAGFPERLYAELSRRGLRFSAPTRAEGGNAALPARVVDLGCGTGTLARGFAARGAEVTGVDISAELLSQAELVARAEGLEITWHQAAAEQTGLAAGAYDLVSAGQCWHWFDRPRAAREVLRLLRPGAAVLVAHFDYLVVPGGVVQATEEILFRECGEPTAAVTLRSRAQRR